jgi:putative LysE/RhtB family amino acid efflux pump
LLGMMMAFVGSMPPTGPVSLLVLSRGLRGEPRAGLAVAMGAALPESGWALLAYLGLGALLPQHPFLATVLGAAAAPLLVGLGVTMLVRRHRPGAAQGPSTAASGALGLSVSLLNPTLLASWSGALVLAHAAGATLIPGAAPAFACGVATGSICWFSLLLCGLDRWRHRLSPMALARSARYLGVLPLGLGLWLGARTLVTVLG